MANSLKSGIRIITSIANPNNTSIVFSFCPITYMVNKRPFYLSKYYIDIIASKIKDVKWVFEEKMYPQENKQNIVGKTLPDLHFGSVCAIMVL